MELAIGNRVIVEPIENILYQLKNETGGIYLKDIERPRGDYIMFTCPFHKDGQENHPSCQAYLKRDNPEVQYGFVYCFTCGKKVPLWVLVGHCFGKDDEFGKEWLKERYGDTFLEGTDYLQEIELESSKEKNDFLSEDILNQYNQYHPYMSYRKLEPSVLYKFKIGYDSNEKSITFPVWDDKGRLVMITRRSVEGKQFHLASAQEKPVYLLNFIKSENITTVYVCESQINALTLWGWGYPSVGLFGTGSRAQHEILRKSGIRNYILCFDGDSAGDKGRERFINAMDNDVLITTVRIPRGKDVNDLTKDEFDKLERY